MKAILCKGVCIVSCVVTNEEKVHVYANKHWIVTLMALFIFLGVGKGQNFTIHINSMSPVFLKCPLYRPPSSYNI